MQKINASSFTEQMLNASQNDSNLTVLSNNFHHAAIMHGVLFEPISIFLYCMLYHKTLEDTNGEEFRHKKYNFNCIPDGIVQAVPDLSPRLLLEIKNRINSVDASLSQQNVEQVKVSLEILELPLAHLFETHFELYGSKDEYDADVYTQSYKPLNFSEQIPTDRLTNCGNLKGMLGVVKNIQTDTYRCYPDNLTFFLQMSSKSQQQLLNVEQQQYAHMETEMMYIYYWKIRHYKLHHILRDKPWFKRQLRYLLQ